MQKNIRSVFAFNGILKAITDLMKRHRKYLMHSLKLAKNDAYFLREMSLNARISTVFAIDMLIFVCYNY